MQEGFPMDAQSIQYAPDETATITHRLADFASEARFSNIPEDVADYTKLLLLDTIICGIAAGDMQRSQIMHQVLESMGGHPDAVVFSTTQRYPAPLAAMVNAEIMNYLDADEAFFTSSHFAAFNAAAALAEGQRAGASGKELIAAMAVGFDINARLNLASVVLRATQVDEDAKDETRNALREKIRRFRETPSSLSITANGRTFHLKSKYAAGDPWSYETRATWDQVARKFHDFCGHQMSAEKIDRIISQFRALEDIKNLDQEIDLNYDLAATAGGGTK
jgi:2-methylcitrate dehydratase PrpD